MKKYPLHSVDIDHGKNVLTVEVPEHEVRVLKFVHGGEQVRSKGIADPDNPDVIELDESADAEIARLTRRYFRINAPDMVRAAFPNGAEDLERFGFVLGRDAEDRAPAALVKKHKAPKADEGSEPAADEGKTSKAAKAK